VSSWQKAQDAMHPGDFVIVQFGINDASPKTNKFVSIPDFKAEFAKFADVIRAKGATPVFCSPVTSGTYDKDGKFVRNTSRAKYGAAIREVAVEKKVDFIDMTELTSLILEGLDKTAGQDLYVGKSTKDGKPIFVAVEENAQFVGGNEAMMRHMKENLVLPLPDQRRNSKSRCVATFIVNEDGSVSDVAIISKVDSEIDRAVVNAIKSMPRWNPARQNGEAVKQRLSIPVQLVTQK
jgi:TonB family protein